MSISVKYSLDPLLVDAKLLGNDPGRQAAQPPNEAQPLGVPMTLPPATAAAGAGHPQGSSYQPLTLLPLLLGPQSGKVQSRNSFRSPKMKSGDP